MLRWQYLIAVVGALLLAPAQASVVVTATENPSGGTNWSFSGASGTLGTEGECCFLPGATTINPQDFIAGAGTGTMLDTTLAVIAGTNAFGITGIFFRNYGGLFGSNGDIFEGLDIQALGNNLDGASLSMLNGLVLYADSIPFGALNPGTYNFDSYLNTGANSLYYTSLGAFTLIIGEQVATPLPSALPLFATGLGALGLIGWRRKRRLSTLLISNEKLTG